MWDEAGAAVNWRMDPLEALRRWPADRRLAMLHSGRLDRRWSRYSVLAEPTGAYRFTTRSEWIGGGGGEPGASVPAGAGGSGPGRERWTHDPFEDLARLTAEDSALWIGYLSYDVGRWVETLPVRAAADRDWPTVQMQRCPGWLVYDAVSGRWSAHGSWRGGGYPPLDALRPRDARFEAQAPVAMVDRGAFESSVQRVLDYIAAGDVFQVNLAQRLSACCRGEPRTLYRRLAQASPAWYGAYIECLSGGGMGGGSVEPRRVIASTSPELFLDVDGDGRVVTRPIKGTRPASASASELEASEKDTAELNMIVDLVRNDLGRVAAFGSVRVEAARTIESHPTVHHGVATISAKLGAGRSLADLLRATMPGGSITGAPKVRAMQIIEELEPVRRGPYCGAIGAIRGRSALLNIAIRTMLLELPVASEVSEAVWPGRVDFSVGGGIVADSEPAAEYRETLDKAAAMMAALGRGG